MFEELEQRVGHVLARRRERAANRPAAVAGGRVIRDVMDPAFLRDQLTVIDRAAAQGNGNRLPREEYERAYAELSAAPIGLPLMARTSTNSLLQSSLTTCIESRADHLLAAVPEGLSRLAHAVLSDVGIFREFGPCSPLWVEVRLAEGWATIAGRPAFPDSAAPPVPLADDARVIMVGDWGTGLRGAQQVAQRIRERLDEARGREQHLIHLGDVYYSGWREEYETRFLPYWPVEADERDVLCWSLVGNHDMYSGGHGYFGFLLHDRRFRGHWRADPDEQAPSSYFSLENQHWQILGLDSSYQDQDLAGDQADWVAQKLSAPGRRTMLLTHQQPLSAYEPVAPTLTDKVRAAVEGSGRALDAWIWGHEHRCTIYAENLPPYLKFGSCIGHGGVPQPMPDPPMGPAQASAAASYVPPTWTLESSETADENQWLRFGFAVLDFNGPELGIQYVDETGAVNATVAISESGEATVTPAPA